MIERADVDAADARLDGLVRRTPVLETVVVTDAGAEVPVVFKLEYLQIGGSFKFRGSVNAVLSAPEPPREVVIASGGNAGIAAALAARQVDARALVVVPTSAPMAKVDALRAAGAEVVLHGDGYAEAFGRATELANDRSALQLHAYDLPAIVAGAGVVGLEIENQVPDHSSIVVAVGGGGLIAGIAAATTTRIVGVDPIGVPTLRNALTAGEPVDVPVDSVAADSLGARRLGTIAMDVAARRGVESVLVDDDAIVRARRLLWDRYRILVEFGGAAALAAILCGAYVPASGELPVVVLCGANTDPNSL